MSMRYRRLKQICSLLCDPCFPCLKRRMSMTTITVGECCDLLPVLNADHPLDDMALASLEMNLERVDSVIASSHAAKSR